MSVPSTISMVSIRICVAEVQSLHLVLALVPHELLVRAHARSHAPEPCWRRATPRWKRTDLPLPLGVSGQGAAAALRQGRAARRARAAGAR